ncbi:DnaT-like ssDNA-binding domain-containing protein [Buttiauxella sp.]|uniref:DnaT-like ssDNA-binding domain-containing protein n=1 Tax=Buttiauxella sp. TaxID=1972222 RepID=UPI003C73A7EC
MAGEWIKMRADLHTHPKVVRMASALKADRLRVIGALHATWCLFDVHSTDGFLDGYTPETLDDMINFAGFSTAMMAVGWLENKDGNLVMPRFDEHNGQSAKRRAQEASRKKTVRKMSASDADKKRTREEKRREDLKDKPPLSEGVDEIPPCGLAEEKIDEIAERPQAPPGNGEPSGKFPMWEGWYPSPDFQRRAAIWNRILTGPAPGFAEHELASFTDYWASEGKVFTQTQWEQKFADSVLYERKRTNQLEQNSGGNHAGNNNDAGESAALRQVREARAEWEQQQGMGSVGNHGGNLFEPLGNQERNDAGSDLDGSDWFHDGHSPS